MTEAVIGPGEFYPVVGVGPYSKPWPTDERLDPALLESGDRITEIATGPALRQYVDSKKRVDLFILDGEANPEGGIGIARELKDEVFNCPPVLLIAGRPQDSWLATWSRADDVVLHPIDPFTFASKAADLLRSRAVVVG